MKKTIQKTIPVIFATIFLLTLYYSINILGAFYIAFLLSYLILPLVEKLESNIPLLSHKMSATIVYVILLLVIACLLFILIPILYQQVLTLIDNLSKIIQQTNWENLSFGNFLYSKNLISIDTSHKIDIYIKSVAEDLFSYFSFTLGQFWEYTLATLGFLSTLFIVPFILFYLLTDWKIITNNTKTLFLNAPRQKLLKFFQKLDQGFSNYIRGQFIIIIIMSFYYTLIFTLLGIDLALILGVISGILIIVPFVGNMISFVMIIANGFFIFGISVDLLYLGILFALGGVVEGWIITPKVIGDSTGLHPIWILFGIVIGGHTAGILGIILSVPVLIYYQIIIKMYLFKEEQDTIQKIS